MNDIDNHAFSTAVLKNVMDELLDLLGQQTKPTILKDMKSNGIDLDDPSASYSLHEIRRYFHLAFGGDAAELLVDTLRKSLERLDNDI